MYTIYVDDKLVYAPHLSGMGFAVTSPKVEVELGKAGSAEFNLPPDNNMYNGIKKLKSEIIVYDEKDEGIERDEIFRGRVLHDEKDFYNQKNVYCEGELSYLIDSVVRPYSYQGDVENLFKQFVNSHNGQVEEEKRFAIGQVTVTDPNDYITRESSEYPSSFDEMNSKLVDLLGGYLRPRLSGGIRYLDYVTEYGDISDQTIEFGKNLLDISEYISAEDVFTVLIPLGSEQQDENGNSSGRLTISSVNGGKDYIEDEDAIKLFGRIVKVQTWDDVTIASNLLSKGEQFLKQGIEMAISITIKALDLHLIGVDVSRIKLGDYVRVVSYPHNIDQYFLCSKISYDLQNPENTEYTLGINFTSLTDQQTNQQKTNQNNVNIIKSAAQSAQNSAEQANNTMQIIKDEAVSLNDIYPIGSVYTAVSSDSLEIPGTSTEIEESTIGTKTYKKWERTE